MDMIQPAWMSKDTTEAVAAVKQLTDQAEILLAARGAPDRDARLEAIGMLKAPVELAEIAKNAEPQAVVRSDGVRAVCNANLTDEELLLDILQDARSYDTKVAAIHKLIEQASQEKLAHYVQNHANDSLRTHALTKVTDQALLAEVAVHDKDKDMRAIAILNLDDEKVLSEIAQNRNEREYARIVAVDRITDQAILEKLLNSIGTLGVRIAVIENLTDRSLLAVIAGRDWDEEARDAAYDRLAQLCGKETSGKYY